jgi:hypothetical protein
MLRNVRENSDAIAAEKFSPEIPFRKKDITYTIGSHWLQKYLTVIDGEFFVLPKYWSFTKGDWEPYSIFNWRSKPYSLNCYGCHTVGFDPVSKTLVEDAIGCEACHGPGAKHAASQEPADIVNPARLEKRLRDNICEACHTDGNDLMDRMFPFAAGFSPASRSKSTIPTSSSRSPVRRSGTRATRPMRTATGCSCSTRRSSIRNCERAVSGVAPPQDAENYYSKDEYCATCHYKYDKGIEKHARHKPGSVKVR